MPFVGHTARRDDHERTRQPGLLNAAASTEPAEANVYGTPVSELSKPELWKLEQNGLDIWDRLIAHAESDQLPDEQGHVLLSLPRHVLRRSPRRNPSCCGCVSPPGS